MAKCPICEARATRPAVDALVENGGDIESVKRFLSDRGVQCSTYLIRKHFRDHTKLEPSMLHDSLLQKIQPTKAEREAAAQEKRERAAEVKDYLDNVATIDLDRVLTKIGVNPAVNSMEEVLNLVQRFAIGLHTMSSAIAFDRLERFMRDPEGRKYPSLEMKGAGMTSSMVAEAFAFQQLTSLQSAADSLERAGYKIIEPSSEKSEEAGQKSE